VATTGSVSENRDEVAATLEKLIGCDQIDGLLSGIRVYRYSVKKKALSLNEVILTFFVEEIRMEL
jgi:hypothetical protein